MKIETNGCKIGDKVWHLVGNTAYCTELEQMVATTSKEKTCITYWVTPPKSWDNRDIIYTSNAHPTKQQLLESL